MGAGRGAAGREGVVGVEATDMLLGAVQDGLANAVFMTHIPPTPRPPPPAPAACRPSCWARWRCLCSSRMMTPALQACSSSTATSPWGAGGWAAPT